LLYCDQNTFLYFVGTEAICFRLCVYQGIHWIEKNLFITMLHGLMVLFAVNNFPYVSIWYLPETWKRVAEKDILIFFRNVYHSWKCSKPLIIAILFDW